MSASDVELDMYNELTNIGGGNAATALSQMVSQRVSIGLPESAELHLAEMEEWIGDADGEVALVLITVVGELAGSLALVLADPDPILEALGATGEFADSALAEIGNITASRFLVSIGQMIQFEGEVEPPAVGWAPRQAALSTVIALAADAEPFFALRMSLEVEGSDEGTELVYFPNSETVDRLRGLV